MNIFDLLDPMMKFKDYRGCSETATFRICIYVGSKLFLLTSDLPSDKVLECLYVSKSQDSSQVKTIIAQIFFAL